MLSVCVFPTEKTSTGSKEIREGTPHSWKTNRLLRLCLVCTLRRNRVWHQNIWHQAQAPFLTASPLLHWWCILVVFRRVIAHLLSIAPPREDFPVDRNTCRIPEEVPAQRTPLGRPRHLLPWFRSGRSRHIHRKIRGRVEGSKRDQRSTCWRPRLVESHNSCAFVFRCNRTRPWRDSHSNSSWDSHKCCMDCIEDLLELRYPLSQIEMQEGKREG